MSKSTFIIILTLFLSSLSVAQDMNHYKSLYVCSYFHRYDSLKGFYEYYQVGFNDKLVGISQREYHAPDSIAGYVDYMTMYFDENGKRIIKGIFYEMFPNNIFFGIGYRDWSGELHGNYVHFRYDGTIKENNLYNRGKLMEKWRYNEEGKLIENVKYLQNE